MAKIRLTRFVHSCVLAELPDQTVLIDPGQFSYESGLFDLAKLERLDKIIVTHEHFDHFHQPFVEEVMKKFPDAVLVTTQAVHDKLGNMPEEKFAHASFDHLQVFDTTHARTPLGMTVPENIGVHVSGLFTHPGDSHSFNESRAVLAMPMTAPWGSITAASYKIQELKPKYVLPIHDWHWKPEAVQGVYESLRSAFNQQGIDFMVPTDGETIDLDIA